MDTVNVLVWGTAAQGPCAYFRGHLYDEPLAKLGVNLRHIGGVGFKAVDEYAHDDCNGGCERCRAAYRAGKMAVDSTDMDWADVVMFRRYYNTSLKCRLDDSDLSPCKFRTQDPDEAAAHEHGCVRQDDITRAMWPAFRDHWTGGMVYETDDDHFNIQDWNGYYGDVVRERDLIRDMARSADIITVTTPILAERYGRFNPRIRVIRNAIDPALYVKDAPRPAGDLPRLVYYGSTARMRDYAGRHLGHRDVRGYAYEAVEAHKHLLTRVFLGTNVGTEHVIERFFDEQTPYIGDIAAFSRALANAHGDIGIAPLGGDEFDRAKSELHWLEYAMSDMAFIGQRYKGDGPYSVVREGVDGLLARGAQEWHDAVKRLATSRDLREQLAGAAKERVLRDYDYRDRAPEWAEVFRFAAENPGIHRYKERAA